ncbi:MAG: diaminopimelate decarboxylase [Pseudomonadota bacterium]
MNAFAYIDNRLCVNGHDLAKIAAIHGTPGYVYSVDRILENYHSLNDALEQALPDHKKTMCYAVKANSHIAVLNLLARQGCGADIVSGGELFRCLKAGIRPQDIVFSGVGKTDDEIEFALKSNILQINAESLTEVARISEIAQKLNKPAPIGLRINPDVIGGDHDKISTGRKDDKFGIDYAHGLDGYKYAATLPGIDLTGISVHIGSQITSQTPFNEAYSKIASFIDTLNNHDIHLKNIDLGGGMGITYTNEQPLDPAGYARTVHETVGRFDARLIFEPGRALTGDAGVLLARVQYVKTSPSGRNFVILDTGMSEMMRPALYGSKHPVLPCIRDSAANKTEGIYDIVGPICESSDVFDRDLTGPLPQPGEIVAIMVSGAYGMSMASNYNTRPHPLEIIAGQTHIDVISPRKDYNALIAGETIPEWLSGI